MVNQTFSNIRQKVKKKKNGGSDVEESACSAGDQSPIPGLQRSPGVGNSYPLHCFCLENHMDRGSQQATLHGVAKDCTRLSG